MSFKSHTIRGKGSKAGWLTPSLYFNSSANHLQKRARQRRGFKKSQMGERPHPQPILWLNTEGAYQSLELNLAPGTLNMSWLTPPGSCVFRRPRDIPFGVSGMGLSVLSRLPCVSCPKQEIFCRPIQSDPTELATS